MERTQAQRPQAKASLQHDDARVRVTRFDFQPGEETGHHRHEHPYVIVPITDGKLLLEEPAGPRETALDAGVSYTRPAGVEHNVVNRGDRPLSFLEIELKG